MRKSPLTPQPPLPRRARGDQSALPPPRPPFPVFCTGNTRTWERGEIPAPSNSLQVVVYSESGRSVGLVVERILDIVETVVELQAVGAPSDGPKGDKVSVRGSRVPLGFELVQTFALALHELATNATKHGALRQEQGRLDISWHVRRDGATTW